MGTIKDSTMHTMFISHKAKDRAAVDGLKEVFRQCSDKDKLQLFFSEDIPGGTPWRQAILETLARSDFLTLLYIDPQDDWSWCMYEAGLFQAVGKTPTTTTDRLIYCLHHVAYSPPNPISHLQSIPNDEQMVHKWLAEIYDKTDQNSIYSSQIPTAASAICKLFEKRTSRRERRVSLCLKKAQSMTIDDLPDDALITGEPRTLEDVFQVGSDTQTWRQIKDRFCNNKLTGQANLMSLKEISRSIDSFAKNGTLQSLQGVLFAGDGPERFRPVLERADLLGDDEISCELLLVRDVGGRLQNVDEELSALLTAIRMAIRIRFEVIKPFVVEGDVEKLAEANPGKLRHDIQTCLNNIFNEAEFRGLYTSKDSDLLMHAFGDSDKTILTKIAREFNNAYPKIWNAIGFKHVGSFDDVVDAPFDSSQVAQLIDGLESLKKINRQFLKSAIREASRRIENEIAESSNQNTRRRVGHLPRAKGKRSLPHRKSISESPDATRSE